MSYQNEYRQRLKEQNPEQHEKRLAAKRASEQRRRAKIKADPSRAAKMAEDKREQRRRKMVQNPAIDAVYNAKRRGIPFLMERAEYNRLCRLSCRYCGYTPTEFDRNGVDRLDNDKGYTDENVVPCCKFCNVAKMQMTVEEFEQHIRRITSHTKEHGWPKAQ